MLLREIVDRSSIGGTEGNMVLYFQKIHIFIFGNIVPTHKSARILCVKKPLLWYSSCVSKCVCWCAGRRGVQIHLYDDIYRRGGWG